MQPILALNTYISPIFNYFASSLSKERHAIESHFHGAIQTPADYIEKQGANTLKIEINKLFDNDCRLVNKKLISSLVDVAINASCVSVKKTAIEALALQPFALGKTAAPALAERWQDLHRLLIDREATDFQDRIYLVKLAKKLLASRNCPRDARPALMQSLAVVMLGNEKTLTPDPDRKVQHVAIEALASQSEGKNILKTVAFGGGHENQKTRVRALEYWLRMPGVKDAERFLELNRLLSSPQEKAPEILKRAADALANIKDCYENSAIDTLQKAMAKTDADTARTIMGSIHCLQERKTKKAERDLLSPAF